MLILFCLFEKISKNFRHAWHVFPAQEVNKPTLKYVKLEIFIAICIMFVYNFLFIKRILQNLDFENEIFIYVSNVKQIGLIYVQFHYY